MQVAVTGSLSEEGFPKLSDVIGPKSNSVCQDPVSSRVSLPLFGLWPDRAHKASCCPAWPACFHQYSDSAWLSVQGHCNQGHGLHVCREDGWKNDIVNLAWGDEWLCMAGPVHLKWQSILTLFLDGDWKECTSIFRYFFLCNKLTQNVVA